MPTTTSSIPSSDLGTTRRVCVMEHLAEDGVEQLNQTKCLEITPEGVRVAWGGGEEVLPCDGVVVAVGVRPNDFSAVEFFCKEKGIPYYTIGDALKPRRAIDATADGARVAREI